MMAQRKLCDFVIVIFQGIQTSIAKKPYIFVIFQGGRGGGGPDPLVPPLDPHMLYDLFFACRACGEVQ